MFNMVFGLPSPWVSEFYVESRLHLKKKRSCSPGEQVSDFVFDGGLTKLPSATTVGDVGLVAWMMNPLKLSPGLTAASLTVIVPPGTRSHTCLQIYIHMNKLWIRHGSHQPLCVCGHKTWTSKYKRVHQAVKNQQPSWVCIHLKWRGGEWRRWCLSIWTMLHGERNDIIKPEKKTDKDIYNLPRASWTSRWCQVHLCRSHLTCGWNQLSRGKPLASNASSCCWIQSKNVECWLFI